LVSVESGEHDSAALSNELKVVIFRQRTQFDAIGDDGQLEPRVGSQLKSFSHFLGQHNATEPIYRNGLPHSNNIANFNTTMQASRQFRASDLSGG